MTFLNLSSTTPSGPLSAIKADAVPNHIPLVPVWLSICDSGYGVEVSLHRGEFDAYSDLLEKAGRNLSEQTIELGQMLLQACEAAGDFKPLGAFLNENRPYPGDTLVVERRMIKL